MDDFLVLALKKMNRFDEKILEQLSSEFRTSLENNFSVFGKHAFRKHSKSQDSRSVG